MTDLEVIIGAIITAISLLCIATWDTLSLLGGGFRLTKPKLTIKKGQSGKYTVVYGSRYTVLYRFSGSSCLADTRDNPTWFDTFEEAEKHLNEWRDAMGMGLKTVKKYD